MKNGNNRRHVFFVNLKFNIGYYFVIIKCSVHLLLAIKRIDKTQQNSANQFGSTPWHWLGNILKYRGLACLLSDLVGHSWSKFCTITCQIIITFSPKKFTTINWLFNNITMQSSQWPIYTFINNNSVLWCKYLYNGWKKKKTFCLMSIFCNGDFENAIACWFS